MVRQYLLDGVPLFICGTPAKLAHMWGCRQVTQYAGLKNRNCVGYLISFQAGVDVSHKRYQRNLNSHTIDIGTPCHSTLCIICLKQSVSHRFQGLILSFFIQCEIFIGRHLCRTNR